MKANEILHEAAKPTIVLPIPVAIFDDEIGDFINKRVNMTFYVSDIAEAIGYLLEEDGDAMSYATAADVLTKYQGTYAQKADQIFKKHKR